MRIAAVSVYLPDGRLSWQERPLRQPRRTHPGSINVSRVCLILYIICRCISAAPVVFLVGWGRTAFCLCRTT